MRLDLLKLPLRAHDTYMENPWFIYPEPPVPAPIAPSYQLLLKHMQAKSEPQDPPLPQKGWFSERTKRIQRKQMFFEVASAFLGIGLEKDIRDLLLSTDSGVGDVME